MTSPNFALDPGVLKELKEIHGDLNESFKDSNLFHVGSDQNWSDIPMWIPTGVDLLDAVMTSYDKDDKVLGRGWACGRWYEVFGPEAGGKTTLYIRGLVECQKMGGFPVLIDSEARFYKPRAQKMGLDLSSLTIIDAPYIERGIESIDKLLNLFQKSDKMKRRPVMIAWDTIATVPTKAELEKGKYAGGMGDKPRAIHQMIRDLVGKLPGSNACLVLVNQVRDNIGAGKYEKQTDTTGGWGTRFQSSVRIEVTKFGQYTNAKDKEDLEGILNRYKIVKSSLFKPMAEIETALNAEYGIDNLLTTVSFHVQKSKLISSKGGRYKCEEYQGKDATGKYLADFLKLVKEDELFYDFLRSQINNHRKQFWMKAASYSAPKEE